MYLQIFAWSNYQIIRHLVICDYIKLKVISKSERFAAGTLCLSHWKYCFCTVGKVWNGMCYKKECYYSKNAFLLKYNSDYEVKLISLSIGLHIFSNDCEGNYISFLRQFTIYHSLNFSVCTEIYKLILICVFSFSSSPIILTSVPLDSFQFPLHSLQVSLYFLCF